MSDGTEFAREELRRVAVPNRDAAVAIGVFDGVHRGHRHLIGHLVDRAGREGLARLVVTFHPHPRTVIRPGTPLTYLCGLEERVELLKALGIDDVAVLAFTSELSQLTARDFVSLAVEELHMKLLVIGSDFALGRGREGTTDVLAGIGAEMGFEVDVVSLLAGSGEADAPSGKVGSTAIRHALERGDMETAAGLLGRPFALRGPVIKGAERGKGLGFPTANMAFGQDRALPAFGVYVTRAYLVEGAPTGARLGVFPAVTNIGLRPTFDEDKPTVETFILDFQGEVYGRDLRIELLHRLRGEIRFPNVDALREQIEKDVAATRAYLA